MTADDKYSLCNSENLQQLTKMQLSKRVKVFFEYIAQFLESISNFKHFEKTMTLVAYVVSKLQNLKVMVRQMPESPRFIALFYGQHVKGPQILVKSP